MVFGRLKAEHDTLSGRLHVAQECVLFLAGRRRRYKVANHSMKPSLHEGDFVLVNPKAFDRQPPKVGDIVVAKHPTQPSIVIIKRISRVDSDSVQVASDNRATGEDSRHFGAIPNGDVVGQVTAIVT